MRLIQYILENMAEVYKNADQYVHRTEKSKFGPNYTTKLSQMSLIERYGYYEWKMINYLPFLEIPTSDAYNSLEILKRTSVIDQFNTLIEWRGPENSRIRIRLRTDNIYESGLYPYKYYSHHNIWLQKPDIWHNHQWKIICREDIEIILPSGVVYNGPEGRIYYDSGSFYVYFSGVEKYKKDSMCMILNYNGNDLLLSNNSAILNHIAQQRLNIENNTFSYENPANSPSTKFKLLAEYYTTNRNN